ncbi:MAG TPA: hypothetical protein VFI23_03525 [Rhizomicrobium sp.]|nr:hypothetical protein [Rhizomicrobium sp.]
MVHWKFAWAFCICAAMLVGASNLARAGSAAPITKIESRTLPPHIVTQRIFEQLARQMRFDPYPAKGRRPKLRLWDMQLWTVPRSSQFPELCESNFVTVHFDPVEPEHGADTKVSATGLEVDHAFRFLSEPASPARTPLDGSSQLKADKVCGKLKPDSFFLAPDDNAVVSSINAFQNAVRVARSTAPLSFPCKFGNVTAEECQRDLAKLEFARITEVRQCNDLDGNECYRIWLPDMGRSITIRCYNAGGTITKVDIGELVTISDERRD